jgi:hypothetical protein
MIERTRRMEKQLSQNSLTKIEESLPELETNDCNRVCNKKG